MAPLCAVYNYVMDLFLMFLFEVAKRVCWPCMDEKFNGVTVLKPCPLDHEEDSEDSDGNDDLPCQVKGLLREHVNPDPAAYNSLLKEEVYCENKDYGCKHVAKLKKLKDHLETCNYKPTPCKNEGCKEIFSHMLVDEHLKKCGFSVLACHYCGTKITRDQLSVHYKECPSPEFLCLLCNRTFTSRVQLKSHQQVSGDCFLEDGRCTVCDEIFDSAEDSRNHLKDPKNKAKHIEAMVTKTVAVKIKNDVGREMKSNLSPVIKSVAVSALDVRRLKYKSEEHVEQIDTLEKSIGEFNEMSASFEEHPGFIPATMEGLTANSSDFDKRLQHLELATYDSTLIWKISEYKKKKLEAIRGRQTSIYSHPFYSSKTGYKMCGQVYLNGDGAGKNRYLSIFFVLMKGDYDDLLSWPFRKRVTFSFLAPRQSQANHTVPLMPGITSFPKPREEMNVVDGCPQFLLQSEVESSQYLVNDCLYIRIKVEAEHDSI